MGFGIMIPGAHFTDERYIVGKVKIPKDPIPECDHAYDNDCDTTCNLCGAVRTITHNYVDGFCTVCGQRDPDHEYTIDEYPVKDGLQGLYALGGTAAATLENHASNPTYLPSGGTPRLEGNYTIEDSYVTFQSGLANARRMHTYLRLPLGDGLTYVALFSVPSGTGAIISNKGSQYPCLSLSNGDVRVYSSAIPETVSSPISPPIRSNNFAIVAVTADTNGVKAFRYSNGSLNTITEYAGVVDAWTDNSLAIQIGGDGSSTPYDTAHISLAAVHTGKLTDEQLESVCEFVKIYGEQKGLVVE